MQDVKDGHINTVLIKDLSRLGRNYLEVGNIAEVFLPAHGCELISLNEKVDDMAVFRNWFNEHHSRSTSQKVKSVFRMCAKDGKFTGSYAPYGYVKSPENKHVLVPDELTATIVQRIFKLRASGMSFNSIASLFNEEEVTPPREHYYQQRGDKDTRYEVTFWNKTSVAQITRNEVYIGNMVSLKTGSQSYKTHKQVKNSKEEWIRVENTHEPLIDRELWDRVKALDEKKYKSRPKKDGTTNIFSGLLICEDCGRKMRFVTTRRKRKDGTIYEYGRFICSVFSECGKSACTSHSLSEKALHALVAGHIRSHAMLVKFNEKRIIDNIIAQHTSETTASRKNFATELKNHNKRLISLDKLIENLYEDKVTGIIPETVFKQLIQKYEQERIERQQSVKSIEQRMSEIKGNTSNATLWAKQIKQFTTLEKLDADTTYLLIDKILISEPKMIDGVKVCEIKIIYNHVGDMEWLNHLSESFNSKEDIHGKAI